MQNYHRHLIIRAGGAGQRGWPLSRKALPKQLQDPLGQGQSLLQSTAERFESIIPPENVWVVTQAPYVAQVKRDLPLLRDEQILCEPTAKNTAPCIAYACQKLATKHPKAQVVITPADHVVGHRAPFVQAVQQALVATASTDRLALIGVPCTSPVTGYGYIAFDAQASPVKAVQAFVEKPTLAKAQAYLAQGNYAWNTGVVVGSLTALSHHYQAHLPDLWQAFEPGKQLLNTPGEQAFMAALYQQLSPCSFDHGILEKAQDLLLVLSSGAGWSDLGAWQALYEHTPKDAHENAIQGNVAAVATQGCMIKGTDNTLIAAYGVKDLIIVHHDHVVMVCPRDQEQAVKALLEHIATVPEQEDYL